MEINKLRVVFYGKNYVNTVKTNAANNMLLECECEVNKKFSAFAVTKCSVANEKT